MDTIVIKRRQNDYKAYIKYRSEIWGCGKNRSEAVGDLVLSHPEIFIMKAEYINRLKK